MELALTVLISTTLTCVGLLALWAARSPWHWFLRTAVFLGVFAPLLLIPAFEPFVAFALQGAIVIAGLSCLRSLRLRHDARTSSLLHWRFSLVTMLLWMALVAIGAAIYSRMTSLNLFAWRSIFLIGATSGVATLLGHWSVNGQIFRWLPRLTLGACLTFLASLPIALYDRFMPAIEDFYVWPPDDALMTSFNYPVGESSLIWIPIIVAIFCLTAGACFLMSFVSASAAGFKTRSSGMYVTGFIAVFSAVLIAPPLWTYYLLMTPLPIPNQDMPNPNGYYDIVAACELAAKGKFENLMFEYHAATRKELANAVIEMKPAYERLGIALTRDVLSPISEIDYPSPIISHAQAQRALARAVSGRGWLFELDSRIQNAMESYLDVIRLGHALRRGSLPNEAEFGIAIANMGAAHLYGLRNQLSPQQCSKAITALQEFDCQVEPAKELLFRDWVWMQHSMGWVGHLRQILWDISTEVDWQLDEGFHYAWRRDRAIMRLLQLELAISAWRATRENLPRSLDELVPEFVSDVALDPFSLSGDTLRYHLVDDGYVLYSLGQNGVDDGGSEELVDYFFEADLRLDALYSDEFLGKGVEYDGDSELLEEE